MPIAKLSLKQSHWCELACELRHCKKSRSSIEEYILNSPNSVSIKCQWNSSNVCTWNQESSASTPEKSYHPENNCQLHIHALRTLLKTQLTTSFLKIKQLKTHPDSFSSSLPKTKDFEGVILFLLGTFHFNFMQVSVWYNVDCIEQQRRRYFLQPDTCPSCSS